MWVIWFFLEISDIVINKILDLIQGHFKIKISSRMRKLFSIEFDEPIGIVKIHERQ